MNIAEILKDCPKGTKLYSPLLGEVELYDINNTINVTLPTTTLAGTFHFYPDGRYWDFNDSECLLFPSKENRDWSTFKVPKQEFPEFKESEDEKIRKSLINFLDDVWHRGKNADFDKYYKADCADWINWLEKHGKKSNWKPSKDEMDALFGLAYITNKMDDKKDEAVTKLYQDLKREFFNGATYENMFPSSPVDSEINIEKQGKQTSDKIEPKFKVGNWVVQAEFGTYKVVEVCKSWYEVIDIEDNHYSISFNNELMCHLWTINDAKPGDVLAIDNSNICLFDGTVEDGRYPFAYCGLTEYQGFRIYDRKLPFTHDKDIRPATKEQYDLLFQKMKEAGYEWDAEKKELKKIEEKPTDKVEPKFKVGEWIRYRGENYEIKDIEITKNGFIYNVSIIGKPSDPEEVKTAIGFGGEKDIVKIEQPAWSEEDEKQLNDIISLLPGLDIRHNWLKSIKDRVQLKQGWSEEDEKMLKRVIDFIPQCMTAHGYNEYINWFKSLKERYTWKPSDEQMEALEDSIEFLGCTKKVRENLKSLYEQLTKLREE